MRSKYTGMTVTIDGATIHVIIHILGYLSEAFVQSDLQ